MLIKLSILIVISLTFFIILTKRSVVEILDEDKCPMCYGTDLCPHFYNESIQLSNDFTDILNYFNVKNVYNGVYKDKRVVLKKLGHNWELKEFDRNICITLATCNKRNIEETHSEKWKYSEQGENSPTENKLLKEIQNSVEYGEYKGIIRNFVVCPNVEDVNILLESFTNIPVNRTITLLNMLTILKLNVEPILLKFFNSDNNRWPIPVFYGACGRIVVTQHAGTPLSSFHFTDYLHRIDISHKLLEMAYTFTFQHPLFRFYLTDVSADNIAINTNNFPIVIDLENVVVLTKSASGLVEYNHSSEIIPCDGCFSFSTEKMCSHYLSDHNIYAFCTLLKEDILTDNSKFPYIEEALLECINPQHSSDRFQAADMLIKELKITLFRHKDKSQQYMRELR